MIYLILIGILSWREVQILIDRGSWKADDYHNLFWYISWKSKWKDFDSFHVANGLATLIICYIIAVNYQLIVLNYLGDYQFIALAIIYWLIWMYIRNIFMHIIFKKKPLWKYLFPQIIYKLWK